MGFATRELATMAAAVAGGGVPAWLDDRRRGSRQARVGEPESAGVVMVAESTRRSVHAAPKGLRKDAGSKPAAIGRLVGVPPARFSFKISEGNDALRWQFGL